jgi:hypothetical protein
MRTYALAIAVLGLFALPTSAFYIQVPGIVNWTGRRGNRRRRRRTPGGGFAG